MNLKKLNWQIWVGFLLTFGGLFTFELVFIKYPATRDFPWANLLLIAVALVFLVLGVRRAFKPGRAIGSKVLASILAALSVAVIGLFLFSAFVLSRQIPAARGAPQVGQKAPDFTLSDTTGKQVSLSEMLSTPIRGKAPKGALLVFYRGYW